ncbi:MAG: DUF4419 domain-containing protein [Bacteroidota bacterium]|nr:DUF4419 domain-containing protein [Bacteroidota bacterium]
MRKLISSIFLLIPFIAFAQKGITFEVETLKKPTNLLTTIPYDSVFKNIIIADLGLDLYEIRRNKTELPYSIIAKNKCTDQLVNYNCHSFFQGMYQAYSDHRPFVLSPDMIWLLISQGFAQHVNNNAEELRKYFVDFDGKLSLIVRNDSIILDDPNSPWEDVFPEFTKQIGKYTGNELIDVLTCDFSTTTPVTKVASQITIMEAMKAYFEFIVLRVGCGIPKITLEGTPEDWQKILDKTTYLRKYKLDWWLDELTPLLKEFVKASKGKIDKNFWQTMFKYHSQKKYMAPNIIDGWIVKFFPYDKDGKKNNLKELVGTETLPKELVKVDLKYIYLDKGKEETTPLELWSGFVGLHQDPNTLTLKPEIGWMVRKKSNNSSTLLNKLESGSKEYFGGINIRVKTVPPELFQIPEIKSLSITFIDKVQIPDEMSKLKIDRFEIYGLVSNEEIKRICNLFPKTILKINGTIYNNPNKK